MGSPYGDILNDLEIEFYAPLRRNMKNKLMKEAKSFPYPEEMTQEELDNVFRGIAPKDS